MDKEKRKGGRPFQEKHIDDNLHIRIKKELLNDFKKICSIRGYKYSNIIRNFIEDYVEDNKRLLNKESDKR